MQGRMMGLSRWEDCGIKMKRWGLDWYCLYFDIIELNNERLAQLGLPKARQDPPSPHGSHRILNIHVPGNHISFLRRSHSPLPLPSLHRAHHSHSRRNLHPS